MIKSFNVIHKLKLVFTKQKNMKKLLIILGSIGMLTSCASHFGMISSAPVNGNVIYQDVAYGVAQTNQYFGIGGISQDALVLEAKRDMMRNRPLTASEEYANFTVDFKNSFWPFYIQTKATVSADVVKKTMEPLENPYSEKYKKILAGNALTTNLFQVGDSILFDKNTEGSIVSIKGIDKVRVIYRSNKGKMLSKVVSIDDIFTTSKPFNGLKVGDSFDFLKDVREKGLVTMRGTVVALGIKYLIVRDITNELVKKKYHN